MIRIPYLREAGAVILLALLAFGGWKLYRFGYTNGHNAANVRAEKVIAEFAKAEAEAQARARAAEQAKVKAVAAIAAEHEKEIQDAKAAADRVVADLRAGNVKLRKLWQAEIATDRLSDAATAARHADEITRLRQEAVGRIHGIGAEADAQVRGLQRYAEEVSR